MSCLREIPRLGIWVTSELFGNVWEIQLSKEERGAAREKGSHRKFRQVWPWKGPLQSTLNKAFLAVSLCSLLKGQNLDTH